MKRKFHNNLLDWRTFSMVGAVLLALGTSNIPVVSATDIDSAAAVSATAYVQILSTTTVAYEATVTRGTDGINTLPWGTQGYQTIGSSSSYLGKTVTVSQEKLADNGVTWALVSLDGKEIGWIAKGALTEATYLAVLSTTTVDYPATITRGTDAINAAPWGTHGFKTLSLSAAYLGKSVTVSQEKVVENGVTWALISLDGTQLGWIAKDALTEPTYLAVLSTTTVDYPATITRGTDSINSAPWGTKGFKTLGQSAAYLGKSVTVSQEKVVENGVTWALISLNGTQLGWIAKDALTEPTYVQILSTTDVDYEATIIRNSDAINSQPWGTKGYKTIGNSNTYVNKQVTVSQEKVADNGVTWALISFDGTQLGWIAKDALKKTVYVQIMSTTDVNYPATITRGTDGINTLPWGTKGYQTVGTSATYLGKQVTVTQEKVADNGVTWALISLNGTQLGWICQSRFD